MSTENDLRIATANWSSPVIVRVYENDKSGQKKLAEEARVLGFHEYAPTTQGQDGGHLHAGRLILTGGFSILGGRRGIRSKGSTTVTYQRVRPREGIPSDPHQFDTLSSEKTAEYTSDPKTSKIGSEISDGEPVDVVLRDFGRGVKINAIKAVMECMELGLKDAKDLVESSPVVLYRGITRGAARIVAAKLEDAGCVVEVYGLTSETSAVDQDDAGTQLAELDNAEYLAGLELVEMLERLGDLKDRGILTEEEFAQQKAQILEKM